MPVFSWGLLAQLLLVNGGLLLEHHVLLLLYEHADAGVSRLAQLLKLGDITTISQLHDVLLDCELWGFFPPLIVQNQVIQLQMYEQLVVELGRCEKDVEFTYLFVNLLDVSVRAADLHMLLIHIVALLIDLILKRCILRSRVFER